MKIIDLAEKQLNNEILPKHIRYNNEDLYFDGVSYCDKQGNNDLLDILAMENSAITHLYDEVEIIEEDKKIPEKLDHLIGYDIHQFDDLKEYVEITTNDLFGKINNIIDTLNEMRKEK